MMVNLSIIKNLYIAVKEKASQHNSQYGKYALLSSQSNCSNFYVLIMALYNDFKVPSIKSLLIIASTLFWIRTSSRYLQNVLMTNMVYAMPHSVLLLYHFKA